MNHVTVTMASTDVGTENIECKKIFTETKEIYKCYASQTYCSVQTVYGWH